VNSHFSEPGWRGTSIQAPLVLTSGGTLTGGFSAAFRAGSGRWASEDPKSNGTGESRPTGASDPGPGEDAAKPPVNNCYGGNCFHGCGLPM
jgi:hypothetical protein